MTAEYIVIGDVAVITMSNPPVNGLGLSTRVGITDGLSKANNDAAVKSIVITGAGKAFSGGADIREFGSPKAVQEPNLLSVIRACEYSAKPVVAAVNGPAVGFGMSLALATDIVFAARSANFALGFVKLGAVLDGGASFLVQRSIGASRARAMALLGEKVGAETLERWGLVWRVVDDEALSAEAMTCALKLAASPPSAVATIKAQLRLAADADPSTMLELEAVRQAEAFSGPDVHEALAAFREKRAPVFGA